MLGLSCLPHRRLMLQQRSDRNFHSLSADEGRSIVMRWTEDQMVPVRPIVNSAYRRQVVHKALFWDRARHAECVSSFGWSMAPWRNRTPIIHRLSAVFSVN